MKIKFNSDNDLPLNKPLKFYAMAIIICFVIIGILKMLDLNSNCIFVINAMFY